MFEKVITSIFKLEDNCNYMPPSLVPSSAKRMATQMLLTEKSNGTKVDDIIRRSKELGE